MKPNHSSKIDHIEARLTNGVWYAQLPGSALWGKGNTVAEAFEDLKQRTDDYEGFANESGMAAIDVRGLEAKGTRLFENTWRNIRILGFVALCCIPLTYAISSGLTRGLKNSDLKPFIALENRILQMGKAQSKRTPEQTKALQTAISNIISSLRPYSSELRLLFVPPKNGKQKPLLAVKGK